MMEQRCRSRLNRPGVSKRVSASVLVLRQTGVFEIGQKRAERPWKAISGENTQPATQGLMNKIKCSEATGNTLSAPLISCVISC